MTGTKPIKPLYRPFALLCVVALLALVSGQLVPGPAVAQGGTLVKVQPASQQIAVGATTVVEIRVENVTGLAAADIELRFNAAVLQVQDADSARDGVQIQPGNFPAPDFVALNTVDNSAGTIRYALTQLPPHTPVNGSGVMATITFRGVNNGTSELAFGTVNLANAQGQPIASSPQNGSITVGMGGPTPPPGATPTPTRPPLTPPPYVTPTPTLPPYVTPTPTPPAGVTTRYTVQPGDTLYSIARRFGVSIWQLATTNNIANLNLIYVGQVLIIPAGGVQPGPGPQPPTPTRYTVQPGDTLYSIARRFGVSVWRLASYNGIVNPNYIYVGQVLIIPAP